MPPLDHAHSFARTVRHAGLCRKWIIPLALLPHLSLALCLGHTFVEYPDQDAYLSGARNLFVGRGLALSFEALAGFVKPFEPTSYFGAGAQLLFGAQIWLFGEDNLTLRLGNVALFGLTLFFFHGICRLWLSERLADLATLFVGLSPFFIIFNQLFLTEMPFLCAELGTFFFVFRYLRGGGAWPLIAAAASSAAGLLIRTNLLFYLPLLAAAIALRRSWRPACAYLALTAILISPYCIRNCINNHAFFPFDGKAAHNLWLFNSDVHHRGYWEETFLNAPEMPPLHGLTEKQRADLLLGIGLEWISTHHSAFLRLAAIKAGLFLSPFPKTAENRRFTWLLTPYATALLVGFFWGLRFLSARDPEHVLVFLLFLYTLSIDMVFMGATRHRLLYDPFFALVAFHGLKSNPSLEKRFSNSA